MQNLLTPEALLKTKRAALVLRALNHKLRQAIIQTILDNNAKITVTEIFVTMRLEQSVASQHLAILRRQGIVKTERDGKFIYYTVDNDRIAEIISLSKTIAQ